MASSDTRISRSTTAAKPLDLVAQAPHRPREVAHDELRFEPEHAVPRALERPIAPRIGARALLVVAAVDLDDEPHLRREQVDDVPAEHGHLPLEPHAEPPATHRLEEPRASKLVGAHRIVRARSASSLSRATEGRKVTDLERGMEGLLVPG